MITSSTSSTTLNGNGVTTAFPFTFAVFSTAELEAWILNADGTYAKTTDWTAVLTTGGGTLTYPAVGATKLPTGAKITILRAMEFTQETDLQNGGAFRAEVVEACLDNLTMQTLQLKEAVARAVRVPAGSGSDPDDYLTTVGAAKDTAVAAAGTATSQAGVATTKAGDAETARAAAVVAKNAAEAAESACAGYQAAVQGEGTTQIGLVQDEGTTQVGLVEDEGDTQVARVEAEGTTQIGLAAAQVLLASNAAVLSSQWAQNPEDDPVEPGEYSAYHWAKKAESAAAGGSFKVSADDTTPGYLEAKLALVSNSGLVLATTSPAGNEVRTIGLDLDTDPGLVLGAGGLKAKVKAASGLNLDADGLWIDLGTDPGLEFTADGIEVKIKAGGGVTKDADGLSVAASGSPVASTFISPFGTALAGTLVCNGAAVSRTTYSDLFTAISTKYGAGDASTTFNVPDYSTAAALIKTAKTYTLATDETSWTDFSLRIVIPTPTSGGNKVRVTLKAGSQGFWADNVSIVERTTNADGAATPTNITFSGSASTGSVAASGTITSDWITFEVDASKSYLLIIDMHGSAASFLADNSTGSGTYYKAATNSYDQQTVTGFTAQAAKTWAVSSMEVVAGAFVIKY